MTTNVRASVSQILRNKDEGGDDEEEPKKKSREDWRKAKELEEARKAGTAPAAVDETGTRKYDKQTAYWNNLSLSYPNNCYNVKYIYKYR